MGKKELKEISTRIRRNIVEMIYHAKSGHPGGSLSIADILTVLYFEEMNIDPKNPLMPNRDRLVLSKGHAVPGVYATLMERGYIDKSLITELRKFGSPLQGHPDLKKLHGIDMSTGSLGQGLSAAQGMALSAKIFGDDFRVYVILGDGEMQEGQIWEAFMSSAHFKLDNLVAFLDSNDLQIDGNVSKVMPINPIADKYRAFNWHVIEINGHCFDEIRAALKEARETKGKPTVIIAKTSKGKGVSFMEDNAGWHGKAPNLEELNKALEELK
ncbi:transketolase [Streptobacillus felis]|uniref:Transketolase n=1 Tax=Streptobacillus felis TaxID=1384509 RepID=A0A7Z0TBX4_9FUSO|nr:transketolase [Streptobacillus felis]NYV27818.1 transketolase [Streptobacillus felis]